MHRAVIYLLCLISLIGCFKENNPGEIDKIFFRCADTDSIDLTNYYAIPDDCINVAYKEEFDDKESEWYTEEEDKCDFTIENGVYACNCEDVNFSVRCHECTHKSEYSNYQIDVDLDIIKNGNYCRLNFFSESYHDGYSFGVTKDTLAVWLYSDDEFDSFLLEPVRSPYINSNGVNKLTLRVVNGTHYLFINEINVLNIENLNIYGDEISLTTGAYSSVEFDNFILTSFAF